MPNVLDVVSSLYMQIITLTRVHVAIANMHVQSLVTNKGSTLLRLLSCTITRYVGGGI